jgi:membrane-anchored protein YejM (alkaline phosphatase superfamily)
MEWLSYILCCIVAFFVVSLLHLHIWYTYSEVLSYRPVLHQ